MCSSSILDPKKASAIRSWGGHLVSLDFTEAMISSLISYLQKYWRLIMHYTSTWLHYLQWWMGCSFRIESTFNLERSNERRWKCSASSLCLGWLVRRVTITRGSDGNRTYHEQDVSPNSPNDWDNAITRQEQLSLLSEKKFSTPPIKSRSMQVTTESLTVPSCPFLLHLHGVFVFILLRLPSSDLKVIRSCCLAFPIEHQTSSKWMSSFESSSYGDLASLPKQ